MGRLSRILQVAQNKAARLVTGHNCYTPTRKLLAACKWLSVRQLVMYQSLVLAHKSIISGTPLYLKKKFCTEYNYQTRQATTGSVRRAPAPNSQHNFSHNCFCSRASRDYNQLPADIRSCRTINSFKDKLRAWIKKNIPID